ncbi:sugar-transfer associated ATP-grasp domain-containing protein [Marinilabilia sp.]|uniref:sugar-transfer associated ATP-grasp domain-containing protein n=1 Tax=Marinilabilia sp. TaxID=2021252 RepID=UPI0025B89DE3|nr:sugar-transfer associated ATP-grasp domain-containing protein [Marinilabilia sp.]
MFKKADIVSYSYRSIRTVAASLYYLRYDLENADSFNAREKLIPDHCRIDADFFRTYKQRWLPWSSSYLLSRSELEVYCHIGNTKSLDYVPWNVWFTSIIPALNNKVMSGGYAEKGNYRKLYGIDNEPLSFLRFLNGICYDSSGGLIHNPEEVLEQKLKEQTKVLAKPAIESWGGKNVLVFERDKKGAWKCANGEVVLSFKNLVSFYKRNFVIQEFLESHPFFKRFNPTSFNSIRVYAYRSPKDEQIHILHTLLKVGGKGSMVDNITAGGLFFYILPDGKFLYGLSHDLKKIEVVPDGSGQPLSDEPKVPGLNEIKALASKIALNAPFHRLLAIDLNIDARGIPRLIEINLSEPGGGVQVFGFPFFGSFTDEVIEFCKSHKKTNFLKI